MLKRSAWAMLVLLMPCCGTVRSGAQAAVESATVNITIEDKAPALSTFAGMGVEFDPYDAPPTVERWATILERLRYARPGFIRVMIASNEYCLGFEKDGTPRYLWDHPEEGKGHRLEQLFKVLDFAQSQGIPVYLGEWVASAKIGLKSPADPRWPKAIVGLLDHLVRQKHYSVINHYILFNEPNGSWMWSDKKPDYAAWSKGIRGLRTELDAHGFGDVLLAGPDTAGGGDEWFDDSVHDLAKDFGVWERHIYSKDEELYGNELEEQLNRLRLMILKKDPQGATKERILAEAGDVTGKDSKNSSQPRVKMFSYGVVMADFVAQMARAGWMGASVWDLDDRMHANQAGGYAMWGLWDSAPASDMAPRPWFYTWSLMSRYFPKGARILKVDNAPEIPRFHATAAEWNAGSGKEDSLLLVNNSDAPRTVSFAASIFATRKVYAYHYFEGDRPVDGQQLPTAAKTAMVPANPSQSITVNMPAGGVILLTTAQ